MSAGYDNARLLNLYRSELDHTYKVRSSLESKATTHMQIISLILGLYGTISTVFFVSRENLDLSSISTFFVIYLINSAITAFLMVWSLIISISVIRIQVWNRPNYNDLVMGSNEQISPTQVRNILASGNANEIDSRIISTLATVLLMNRDNNIRIASLVNKSHQIIIAGLFSFLISLTFLIVIGIQINL